MHFLFSVSKNFIMVCDHSSHSGPSLALCLAREDAVETWRSMLGPKEVAVAKEEAPERCVLD